MPVWQNGTPPSVSILKHLVNIIDYVRLSLKHGYFAKKLRDLGQITTLVSKILTRYTSQIYAREKVTYQNLGSKILPRCAWHQGL